MIDYQKHRENLSETLGRKNPTLTGRFQYLLSLDAEELLDKAEERDKYQKMYDEAIAELVTMAKERTKAVEVAEDLAAHMDDALGYLTTMHEGFQNHASDEAIQLLRDALEAAKKKSIARVLAKDPAPVEEGKP